MADLNINIDTVLYSKDGNGNFIRPLYIGTTDLYSAIVDPDWLGDETIDSFAVTSDTLTVTGSNTGNVIQALLTTSTTGRHYVKFAYSTATRNDYVIGRVEVK